MITIMNKIKNTSTIVLSKRLHIPLTLNFVRRSEYFAEVAFGIESNAWILFLIGINRLLNIILQENVGSTIQWRCPQFF